MRTNAVLQFTILGCGSSAGVPRADGAWGACDPAEPRNRRSRCSLLVRRKAEESPVDGTTIVVDTDHGLVDSIAEGYGSGGVIGDTPESTTSVVTEVVDEVP